jgi:hypothetical protein
MVMRVLLLGVSIVALVMMTAPGRAIAAFDRQRAGRRVPLVSLPDWSRVAWKQGTSVCFVWHGEPTAIETASGCRPPLTSALTLLIGETGTLTRLAGLAAPTVASVTVRTDGRTFSALTKPVPALLGRNLRFFFLQFRPHLSAAQLGSVRWTLLAFDAKQRLRGTLHV